MTIWYLLFSSFLSIFSMPLTTNRYAPHTGLQQVCALYRKKAPCTIFRILLAVSSKYPWVFLCLRMEGEVWDLESWRYNTFPLHKVWDFPGGPVVKNSLDNARVQSLVQEDSTCHQATKPVLSKACRPQLLSPPTAATEVHVPRACALQQRKPLQQRVAPYSPQLEKACVQQ